MLLDVVEGVLRDVGEAAVGVLLDGSLVDGLEAEGFLAMLLPLLDLLPALLVVAVLLLEEREDPPDDGLPKREELVLERPLEEEEEEELTTLQICRDGRC